MQKISPSQEFYPPTVQSVEIRYPGPANYGIDKIILRHRKLERSKSLLFLGIPISKETDFELKSILVTVYNAS